MTDRESILAAIANRRKSATSSPPVPASTSVSSASTSARPTAEIHKYSEFDKDHDRRQEFRRLVDPGITRPNSREVAYEAIKVTSCPPFPVIARARRANSVSKTLSMLARNIIDHPEEEKYHRFKPTNTAIRKKIVDPKGSLEYAVEVRATLRRWFYPITYLTPFVHPAGIQARGKLKLIASLTPLGLILEIGHRVPTILCLQQITLE